MKNALWLFIFALIVLMIFLPSYTRMQDLQQKNLDYAYQIKTLSEDNKRLREEKRRLEEDPVYLEKVGREKMGLVRDGETVYKLMPDTQNKETNKNLNISRSTSQR